MFRLFLFVTFLALTPGLVQSLPLSTVEIEKSKLSDAPTKSNLLKKHSYLSYAAKAVGIIAIPSFVIGEYMMHVNFVKGLCEWITHGSSARSFFSKKPTNALYCATITIRDLKTLPSRHFASKNPSDLIKYIDTFLKSSIDKTKHLVRIMIEPSILLPKTGRKIALAPLYCLWNPEKGITHDLEKKFHLTQTSNADSVFEAVKFFTVGSLLSAPLVAVAFCL